MQATVNKAQEERKRHWQTKKQTIRCLEKKNREINELLAYLVYELGIPLQNISNILSRSHNMQEFAQIMPDLEWSLGYTQRLLNNYSQFAALEKGKPVLCCQEFDPNQIMSNIYQLAETEARQNDVRLRFVQDYPEQLWVGDASILTQILLNLLSTVLRTTPADGSVVLYVLQSWHNGVMAGDTHVNAGEATQLKLLPGKGEKVRSALPEPMLSGRKRPGNNKSAAISFAVENSGQGMADEELSSVFEPFQKLGEVYLTDNRGIGLHVSSRLVELLGGRLQVNSQPGKGSLFFFELEFPVTGK